MSAISNLNKVYIYILDQLKHVFLLAIRLWWGYAFLIAGWGKLTNWERTLGFFTSLNLPFPELSLALAATTEFVGGGLLILGLFSRYISLPLAFTMVVAYLTAHSSELVAITTDPKEFMSAPPFLFLYTVLVILFFGAGKLSLDYLWTKKSV